MGDTHKPSVLERISQATAIPQQYAAHHPMHELPPESGTNTYKSPDTQGEYYDNEKAAAHGGDPSMAGAAHLDAKAALDVQYHLPITGKRNASWAHSAFHNVTAMVGAGVLGLPYTYLYLGWAGGTVTMALAWIISLYTLHQLVSMHEHKGRRFNRYHELGVYAFGPNWGHIIIIIPQLIVMVGLGITYSVTGGRALYHVWGLTCDKVGGHCTTSFGLSAWIVVFTGVQLILIQAPNFNALAGISLLAATMSLTYSTIGIGGSIAAGKQPGTAYNLNGHSTADGILGCFNSLGIVAFAYGGHNIVLEIQAGLPSPPRTYKRFMIGVGVAYAIVSWAYFGVASAGYWAFGNNVADNILTSLQGISPDWLLVFANVAVFLHVLGSYQVYTMPVLDMIETAMVKHGIPNGLITRLIYRSVYAVLIGFIAISIPFFGDLMGFIGALGTGPTTFWLPSVLYLVVKRPAKSNWQYWASWVCIVLGVLVTILGAIGGLRGIIDDASSYSFYQ